MALKMVIPLQEDKELRAEIRKYVLEEIRTMAREDMRKEYVEAVRKQVELTLGKDTSRWRAMRDDIVEKTTVELRNRLLESVESKEIPEFSYFVEQRFREAFDERLKILVEDRVERVVKRELNLILRELASGFAKKV